MPKVQPPRKSIIAIAVGFNLQIMATRHCPLSVIGIRSVGFFNENPILGKGASK